MTTDRRTFMVTSAAALATTAHAPAFAQTGDAASRKARIDALLQKAADAGDVPGVVAMATDRNGTLYEGAFGKRVLGQPAPMTADTVVWIASMTKAVTGAAAMQLVEQGKLDLDAPAAKVVSPARANPSATSRCATCSRTRRASATTSGMPISQSTRR